MFLEVFDRNVTRESMAQKHARIFQDYGIKIFENSREKFLAGVEDVTPPLLVTIKGKKIVNLIGHSCLIYLVDEKYFIIKDSTPFTNIHAYDLAGNWIWDIESVKDPEGDSVEYFMGIDNILTDDKGIRQLIVNFFPFAFLTELETGKNTKLYKIEDISDFH